MDEAARNERKIEILLKARAAEVDRTMAEVAGRLALGTGENARWVAEALGAPWLAARASGRLALVASQVYLERESWLLRCLALGASVEDLVLHEKIVWRLATTSTRRNGDVVQAGRDLVEHRLRRGEPVAPENPRAWAGEMFVTMPGLFGEQARSLMMAVREVLGVDLSDVEWFAIVSRLSPVQDWADLAEELWAVGREGVSGE